MSHFIEVCEYGIVHAQCRCPGKKTVRTVPCGTPEEHAPAEERPVLTTKGQPKPEDIYTTHGDPWSDPPRAKVCLLCGALVGSTVGHYEWHFPPVRQAVKRPMTGDMHLHNPTTAEGDKGVGD